MPEARMDGFDKVFLPATILYIELDCIFVNEKHTPG